MNILITDKELNEAEDMGQLLKDRGVPMVLKHGHWSFDPQYVVDIDTISDAREGKVFVYKWFKHEHS
jgi:hypothetical protein